MTRTEKDKQELDSELHGKLDSLTTAIEETEKLAQGSDGDIALEYHRKLKDLREERDTIRLNIDTVETGASID